MIWYVNVREWWWHVNVWQHIKRGWGSRCCYFPWNLTWEKVKVQRSTGSDLRMQGNQKTPPLFFAVDEEEGLTLHRIFESHDKPLTPRQFLNTNSPHSGSKRLEDSRSNLFSVIALEGKLATLDLLFKLILMGITSFGMKEKTTRQRPKSCLRSLAKGNEKKEERLWSWGSHSDRCMKPDLWKKPESLRTNVSAPCETWLRRAVRREFFGIRRHAPGPWCGPAYMNHSRLAKAPYCLTGVERAPSPALSGGTYI